jgi:hypothetical protein
MQPGPGEASVSGAAHMLRPKGEATTMLIVIVVLVAFAALVAALYPSCPLRAFNPLRSLCLLRECVGMSRKDKPFIWG